MELKDRHLINNQEGSIRNFEVILNIINHGIILITTFYITWYSFTVGFQEYQTQHAWCTTIGEIAKYNFKLDCLYLILRLPIFHGRGYHGSV